MGVFSILWYVGLTLVSENILYDSIAALGLMIAFYYGITGFACAIYYRHELFKSVKTFVLVGVAPVLGGLILIWVFFKSFIDLSKPENSESGDSWLGVGPPLVIGLGLMLFGVVLMFIWYAAGHREFFQRKPEVADPGSLEAPPPSSRPRPRAWPDGRRAPGRLRRDARARRPPPPRRCGSPPTSARSVVFAFAYWTNPPGGDVGDMLTALRELGEGHLARGAGPGRGRRREQPRRARHAAPSVGLVELADRDDARMIVVGSYGEAPLKGALIGSTAHKLCISPSARCWSSAPQ